MAGFSKKNIEYTQRNGNNRESQVIVKYITNMGKDGIDGSDAYQVILSPNNHTFAADTDDQHDRVNVFVFRGTTPINSYIVTSEIQGEIGKGSTNALVVDVDSSCNGTNRAFFDVNVNSNLNVDSSTLIIPIQYNVDVIDSSIAYDASMWDTSIYNIATFNAVYSWNMASSGQSAYVLDLSNENASINADASGNIISTAMRPTCKATLTYGAQDVSTGVTYSISYPSNYGVQGVSINSSTGVLTFNSGTASTPFRFGDVNDPNDTVLEITVDASFNNGKHRQKVMTITKSLPGQSGIPGDPGDDAVSRWIELSADVIRVDSSSNCIPDKITATPWKQVGGELPEIDQSTNIKWAYDSSVTSTAYTGAITVNKNWDYMTFKLYYQSTYLGECETVPIIRDGKNGQPGAQGRKGPAVRGPWLWDSSTNTNKTGLSPRRFCDGTDTYSDSDANWIDIIIHDGTYYRCTTSYNSTVNDTWTGSSGVSGKWTAADASYEFVAAHLLLAENAKINFLSGNELYLMNSNNRITAGAAGGNGISFWAGAEQPSDAPFQVSYDGHIKATSGTFSGYIQIPFTHIGALQHNGTTYYADERAYLISPESASYDPVNFVLPTPSSSWSGFTYDILVTPRRVQGVYGNQLVTRTYNNSSISIFAYAEERTATSVTLTGGRYTITCIPISFDSSYNGTEFQWCIINATAGLIIHGTNRDEYISTLLGTSYETWDMINKVLTYTSTNGKPSSVPWANNTMYVEK